MSTEAWPKKGKHGHPSGYGSKTAHKVGGYKRYKNSVVVQSKEPEYYESQNLGLGKANPEYTRMDMYAKPGTSTAARQPDPYSMRVTRPLSRYRSIRP